MTERLADINARITGIQQLGTVVNAMRGIAAARARQARGELDAVDRYAQTIAAAIADALAMSGSHGPPRDYRHPGPLALVVFCAEQGFAGAFSERVFDAITSNFAGTHLFIAGTRGASLAMERGIAVEWKGAMPSHSQGIPKLADRIAEALYARIAAGGIQRLQTVFTTWTPGQDLQVERKTLLPLDSGRFPAPAKRGAPILNLPVEALLSELTADYVHALLCNAALHAFSAENEARMEAMAAAHHQIEHQLGVLNARQRHVRQEEITAEIIELAAGETASRTNRSSA